MKMNRNAMIVLASVSSVFGACAPNIANTEATNSSAGAATSTNPVCTASSGSYSVRFDVPGLVNVSNDRPPQFVTVGKLTASSGGGFYHLGRTGMTLQMAAARPGEYAVYEGYDQASQGTNPSNGRFNVKLRLEKGQKSGLYQYTTFTVEDRGNASGAGKRSFSGSCPRSNAVNAVADQNSWYNNGETARTDNQVQNRITTDTIYCWINGRTFKPTTLEVQWGDIKFLGPFDLTVNEYRRDKDGNIGQRQQIFSGSVSKTTRRFPISIPGRYEVIVTASGRTYPIQTADIATNPKFVQNCDLVGRTIVLSETTASNQGVVAPDAVGAPVFSGGSTGGGSQFGLDGGSEQPQGEQPQP